MQHPKPPEDDPNLPTPPEPEPEEEEEEQTEEGGEEKPAEDNPPKE
jgi:hypothetical protein